jgi:hypothetical protein
VLLERNKPSYFKKLYPKKNAEQVYQEKVKQLEPIILKILNTVAHSLIKIYAQEFSVLIYEVDFRSWVKAYLGPLNSENRWGFEPSHYYNNSIDPLFKSNLFQNFVVELLDGQSDLDHKEIFFSINWANAKTFPQTNQIENKLHYKLIDINDIQILKDYFDLKPLLNEKFVNNIKIENKFLLLEKNIKNINSYFENILNNINKIYANKFDRKLVNIVDSAKNKCLSITNKVNRNFSNNSKVFYGITIAWENCLANNEMQKWHVIKDNKKINTFKIYSAFRKGYCFTESAILGLSLTLCNAKFNRQNWIVQVDESVINQKTGHKIFDSIKIQENLSLSLISMINIPFNENAIVANFEPYITRFFEIVEDNDTRLQVMNGNRMPSYRVVWSKWSNNEWNPPEEFKQIFRQTQFLRQALTEEQFDNVFQNIQDLSLRDAIMEDRPEVDINENFEYYSRPRSPSLPPFYQEEEQLSFWDSLDTDSFTSTNTTAELQEEMRAFEIGSQSDNMLQSESFLSEVQDLSELFDDIESTSNMLNSNIHVLLQSVTELSAIGNLALAATIVTLIP